MRITLEKAYILHRRPYSNTSLIIEFFTENYGRQAALARSARGLKSRYRGKLEPFTAMLTSWVGKGELKTLGEVEVSDCSHQLVGNALLCGFYLNEILMRLLLRDDPHATLFQYYHEALTQLKSSKNVEVVLRLFEKKLLQELGFGLSFTIDFMSKKPIITDAHYRYIPDCGFTRVQDKFDHNYEHVFCGGSLLALNEGRLNDSNHLKEAKRLMRLALYPHLGVKPLKSRELFSEVNLK